MHVLRTELTGPFASHADACRYERAMFETSSGTNNVISTYTYALARAHVAVRTKFIEASTSALWKRTAYVNIHRTALNNTFVKVRRGSPSSSMVRSRLPTVHGPSQRRCCRPAEEPAGGCGR